MNEIQVGQAVTVRFNGHAYQGEVVGLSKKRFLVRFTTGSGRTRERWYRQEGLHCYQKEAKAPRYGVHTASCPSTCERHHEAEDAGAEHECEPEGEEN